MLLRNLLPYFVLPFMILTLIYSMLLISLVIVSITTYFVFNMQNEDFIYEKWMYILHYIY